jgi:cell division protein FtsQ
MAQRSGPRSSSSDSRPRRGGQLNSASAGATGKRKSVKATRQGRKVEASQQFNRVDKAFARKDQVENAERDISRTRGQGRRAGAIRAEQRAKRQRSQYLRYIGRIGIAIAIVLVVIFGSLFVYRSDLFHVNTVQVNGVSHLTSQEITSIAAVSDSSTLLRLDASGITGRLKDNAWVQDASIRREFPDTLIIDITEREPGAVAKINDKSNWVISTDGTWLSAATSEDWNTSMKIIDVSPSMPAPISGSTCTDGGITNALSILNAISDDLRSRIVSISAESSIKTSLNLEDGVTVAFGDSSNVELKEAAINSLLEQYEGRVSYINVRVPTRPTYRMLNESTTDSQSSE